MLYPKGAAVKMKKCIGCNNNFELERPQMVMCYKCLFEVSEKQLKELRKEYDKILLEYRLAIKSSLEIEGFKL